MAKYTKRIDFDIRSLQAGIRKATQFRSLLDRQRSVTGSPEASSSTPDQLHFPELKLHVSNGRVPVHNHVVLDYSKRSVNNVDRPKHKHTPEYKLGLRCKKCGGIKQQFVPKFDAGRISTKYGRETGNRFLQ